MIAKSYICFWFQWYNDHRVQHLLDLILLPPFNFSFFFFKLHFKYKYKTIHKIFLYCNWIESRQFENVAKTKKTNCKKEREFLTRFIRTARRISRTPSYTRRDASMKSLSSTSFGGLEDNASTAISTRCANLDITINGKKESPSLLVVREKEMLNCVQMLYLVHVEL